ncbi:MAG: DUF3347 domain-containing protein [Bacteroidota bacterium]
MLNSLIRFFLENKVVTFTLLALIIGWGVMTAPFGWQTNLFSRDPMTVDAAAQLQGNTSMMNPAGGKISLGHDHGAKQSGNSSAPAAKMKMEVPKKFREQLRNLFDRYDAITKALVASDPKAVPDAVKTARTALEGVDVSLLSEAMRPRWAEQSQSLRKTLDAIAATRDLEKQRERYSELSNVLYETMKHYGVEGSTVYWQHCPMAFDDKGANWLSPLKEIRNPYFGSKMLKCGTVKEELTAE